MEDLMFFLACSVLLNAVLLVTLLVSASMASKLRDMNNEQVKIINDAYARLHDEIDNNKRLAIQILNERNQRAYTGITQPLDGGYIEYTAHRIYRKHP